MKLRVLGCSGGVGGDNLTSAFLVDDDILLDCGTGGGVLDREGLAKIDYVFISHAHMDHIAFLPLLIDTVGEARTRPVTVYALEETIRALRTHIFNWQIWPDFTVIPDKECPYLQFVAVRQNELLVLGNRTVTPFASHHSVPSVALSLDSGESQLVYTSDTGYSAAMIEKINQLPALRHLIIEAAFPNSKRSLAIASGHLCPSMLAVVLNELKVSPHIHVNHLKPGLKQQINQELAHLPEHLHWSFLEQEQVLEF